MVNLKLGEAVRERSSGNKVFLLTDFNVDILYSRWAENQLAECGFQVIKKVVEGGEKSKSGSVYLSVLESLAENQFTRTDCLVALGGGVVGDLGGFVASTYLRGIDLFHVPTTLLAQVDSSIGGKTAINLGAGKNLAGSFYLPKGVFQDCGFLETLPREILRDGMAEVIKYGVLCSEDLFEKLHDVGYTLRNMDNIVKKCVSIKESFVEDDLRDKGKRQLLNLGHTFGHAIEKLSEYRVSHGEAVAAGMIIISRIAEAKNWCERGVADRIEKLTRLWQFNWEIFEEYRTKKDEILSVVALDKKRKSGIIDLVVPENIGSCRLQTIDIDQLESLLSEI